MNDHLKQLVLNSPVSILVSRFNTMDNQYNIQWIINTMDNQLSKDYRNISTKYILVLNIL